MDMNTSVNSCDVKLSEEVQQEDLEETITETNPLNIDDTCHSVYVTGFDSHTNDAELKQYFSNFGNVTSVVIHKTKNFFSFVKFASSESVKVVTAENYCHILGKRRLCVQKKISKRKSLAIREKFRNRCESLDAVFTSLKSCDSVQNQIEELYRKMKLTEEDIDTRHKICAQLELVLLPYYPRCHVTLFGSSANGYGFKECDVDVLFQANHVVGPHANDDTEEIIVPSVKDVNIGRFSHEYLCKLNRLDELEFIKRVLQHTDHDFLHVFLIPSTRCPIIKFKYKENYGKTISCDLSNGLGILSSNFCTRMKSYRHMRPNHIIENAGSSCKYHNNTNICTLPNAAEGGLDELYGSLQVVVDDIRGPESDVFYVMYPLHNTKLLKLIGKMDNRVIHIMSVLRFWFKYFCNTQNLTSYAFSLLVIFFLQTRNPPVIPTIEYIQSKAGVQVFENGFNCSVPSPCEAEEIEVSSNTQTTVELIAEFFAYYAGFDFVNNVICPLTGNFVSKRVFQTELKDFKMSALCVQDPFQIDRNVASNADFSSLLIITESLQYIDEKFQVNNTNEFWGILGLFQKISIGKKKIKLEIIQSAIPVQNFKEKFCHIGNVEKVFNHIWLIKAAEILLDVLRHGFLFDYDITDLAEDKSILWRKNTREKQHDNSFKSIDSSLSYLDILESINLINPLENKSINSETGGKECNLDDPTVLPIDRLSSQISCEEVSKSSDSCNTNPFLTARFTVSNCTWNSRNLLMPKFQYLGNPLDVEHSISIEKLKEPYSKLKENLIFDLTCYEHHSGGDTILLVWLKPFKKYTVLFRCLGYCLKKRVPKIIKDIFLNNENCST